MRSNGECNDSGCQSPSPAGRPAPEHAAVAAAVSPSARVANSASAIPASTPPATSGSGRSARTAGSARDGDAEQDAAVQVRPQRDQRDEQPDATRRPAGLGAQQQEQQREEREREELRANDEQRRRCRERCQDQNEGSGRVGDAARGECPSRPEPGMRPRRRVARTRAHASPALPRARGRRARRGRARCASRPTDRPRTGPRRGSTRTARCHGRAPPASPASAPTFASSDSAVTKQPTRTVSRPGAGEDDRKRSTPSLLAARPEGVQRWKSAAWPWPTPTHIVARP